MPVTIHRHVAISFDSKLEWKVKQKHIMVIGGVEYLKLPPSDTCFVRFVTQSLGHAINKNATLTHAPGIQQLLKLRNEQQAKEFAESGKSTCSLFDQNEVTPKKRIKRSKAIMREMRDSPGALEVAVPGFEGKPDMVVKVIRPVHPADDICIQLDPIALEFVIGFVRHAGISEDTLYTKRDYKAHDAPKGVWKNGKKGYVVKLPGGKTHRVASIDDAVNYIEDQSAIMDQSVPNCEPLLDAEQSEEDDGTSPERCSGEDEKAPLMNDVEHSSST